MALRPRSKWGLDRMAWYRGLCARAHSATPLAPQAKTHIRGGRPCTSVSLSMSAWTSIKTRSRSPSPTARVAARCGTTAVSAAIWLRWIVRGEEIDPGSKQADNCFGSRGRFELLAFDPWIPSWPERTSRSPQGRIRDCNRLLHPTRHKLSCPGACNWSPYVNC